MFGFIFVDHSSDQNPYMKDPDVKLMLKFKDDEDPVAFEELLRNNFTRIMNFVYRFVQDRELAEDLTQEVFIKIYNNAHNYNPKSKFRTWAFTIAKNISLNELRKRKHKILSLDKPFKHAEDDMAVQVEDKTVDKPDDEMLKKEMMIAVDEAINDLPANQKAAILLLRNEHFSYEEIAKSLETSVSAVKSLISRARVSLKSKLEDIVSD